MQALAISQAQATAAPTTCTISLDRHAQTSGSRRTHLLAGVASAIAAAILFLALLPVFASAPGSVPAAGPAPMPAPAPLTY